MQRSFLFRVHSFAGLISGVFILLMSLSGAALIFHEDIDRMQSPVVQNQADSPVHINKLYTVVKEHYPNALISHCQLPDQAGWPVVFTIYDLGYRNGKASMELFVDPGSGQILKTRGGAEDIRHNFMSWLAAFHNSFHLGKTGEWLLGFFSLVFLLSITSGLFLFRKNIAAVLLFRKRVFKKNKLHQLIGVYALLFNLLIAVTGFWMQRYVFKKEFYTVDNYTRVLKTTPPLPFHFDSAMYNWQKEYPEFTASVIYFAQSNAGKTAVYGSRQSNAYVHSKKFADAVFLDSTGHIVNTRFVNEIDAADRYDIINSQLHMGRFGGPGIKIIYFIFGLSGALLSITGFLLWRRRRKSKKG